MIFQNYVPEGPLDEYVDQFIYFKNFQPDHRIERVVPDGHLYIIFELDGMMRSTYDNRTLQPKQNFQQVWISGVQRSYISISAHPDSEMFVYRFKPAGAYPFLHQPLHKFTNEIFPAEQIFGKSILQFRENLISEEELENKFTLAKEWLLQQMDEKLLPPVPIIQAVHSIREDRHFFNNNLQDLINRSGYSKRHFIQLFKKYIGLTPKYFQRILRFNEILLRMYKKEKVSWTKISYDCGFFDQAHFIKEFKQFSGFNPREFIERDFNQEEKNFFPLDKR